MQNIKETDHLSDITLLLIEDDIKVATTTIAMLKFLVHKVLHAVDGEEGLELFAQYNPQIVISDIRMPKLDGLELSRRIKKIAPQTSIIFITGFLECEHLREAIEIGINSYFSKPVEMNALINKLQYEAKRVIQLQEANEAQHLVDEYLKAFDTSVIFSKTNPKGFITYANEAFERISGYSKDELLGKAHNIIRHPDTPKAMFQQLWSTIQNGQIWKGVIKNRRKDGSSYSVESTIIPILNQDGSIREYMAIRFDITDKDTYSPDLKDAVKYNEELALTRSYELMQQIYIDVTTDIPNAMALRRDIQNYPTGTVFLLDINNFNIFNKIHGYTYGDQLLAKIAGQLDAMMGEHEMLYKLSADQFVILSNRNEKEYIEHFSSQIFAFFDNSQLIIDTIENQITFSIGIANITPERDAVIDAEFALDVSKRYGKRIKVIYNEKSEEFAQERDSITWLNRTRNFIYKDQIVPFYQPIVDVATRKLYKYEALARVIDNGELIHPGKFLSAVDRLGLTTSMTKSMINKTFAQFGGSDIKFSINITERDIMDGYLVEYIKDRLEKYRVNPDNVTFEVLENLTLSQEGEVVAKTIGLIKNYGCHIAIDDFGSENSNFGRILTLQSDYLKIDGMFIRDCDVDEGKQKIVSAIVELAKRLEIKTIAEFVESESVFNMIEKIGVDYAQGYLFGKPKERPQL